MSSIQKLVWRGLEAWALESDMLRVVIVPELGAKIVSLLDKRAGHEWLVGPMRPPRLIEYGAPFTEQDMSGWDEMMPTIEACTYPGPGAYANRALPDHGEVWSLPWTRKESEDNVLAFSVLGRALPYRFQRTARLIDSDTLQLDYQLSNLGTGPFHYLWAAHPQFTCDTETVIILPPEIQEVCSVLPGRPWGPAGTRLTWPVAVAPDGNGFQLDHIGRASRHDCRKFYLPPEVHADWAELRNPRTATSLHLKWSHDSIPYLGIWIDEGMYNSVSVVALEPSNGYYDSLARAYSNDRAKTIEGGTTHAWTLAVRLS